MARAPEGLRPRAGLDLDSGFGQFRPPPPPPSARCTFVPVPIPIPGMAWHGMAHLHAERRALQWMRTHARGAHPCVCVPQYRTRSRSRRPPDPGPATSPDLVLRAPPRPAAALPRLALLLFLFPHPPSASLQARCSTRSTVHRALGLKTSKQQRTHTYILTHTHTLLLLHSAPPSPLSRPTDRSIYRDLSPLSPLPSPLRQSLLLPAMAPLAVHAVSGITGKIKTLKLTKARLPKHPAAAIDRIAACATRARIHDLAVLLCTCCVRVIPCCRLPSFLPRRLAHQANAQSESDSASCSTRSCTTSSWRSSRASRHQRSAPRAACASRCPCTARRRTTTSSSALREPRAHLRLQPSCID